MKKTSFILIISFFFLIISLLIISTQFATNPPEKELIEAFGISGAKVVSSEICFSGKIEGNEFKTVDNMKNLALAISKGLGAGNGGLPAVAVNNDNMEGVELDEAIDENRIMHVSIVNSKPSGDSDGSYITVSVADSSAKPGLEGTRRNIQSVLAGYRIKPKVTSCITGSIDGRLETSRLNSICSNIFNKTGASRVEGMSDDKLISVSAYTPAIGESVEVNGNRINLNIAIRFNSYENKTYIWLATPVITTEY